MGSKTKEKAKPEPELEELDEDAEEAPAKGKKKGDDDVWGVQDLRKLIKQKYDKEYTPRELRTLLRKMARENDGDGRVKREIVAGNKSRYAWSGPDDPEVKTILKAIKGGEVEAGKKEALAKLKQDKAKKDAAKKDGKAAKKPAADDELEEVDEDDDD